MKYLLIILLFIASEAGAQQMMFRGHNQSSQVTPPLDIYTGATAAYSLRKLRTAYAGAAIRVRRTSDNTEQDIGFTGNGDLDTTALKSFVGLSTGNVVIWYDQQSSNDVTGSANIPIVISGGLVKVNGRPALDFGATDATLAGSTESNFDFTNTFSVFTVGQAPNVSDAQSQVLINKGVGNFQVSGWYLDFRRTDAYLLLNRSGAFDQLIAGTTSNITQMILSWTLDSGNGVAARNGTVTNTYAGFTGATLNNNNLIFGAYQPGTGSADFNGYAQEIIIYPNGQASNRVGIETNINSYYTIY